MTRQLVEFQLEDGSTVVFETDEQTTASPGMERISRFGSQGEAQEVKKAQQKFEQVAAHIRPAAQIVLDALQELNSPKEIGLEFGLAFNAKAGA